MIWLLVLLACSGEPAPAPAPAHAAADAVAFWTCPMHPSIHQDHFGPCPLCGMDLVPVTAEEAASGAVVLDAPTRERVGVRMEAVVPVRMVKELVAAGTVTWDATRARDVALRIDSYVRTVEVAPGAVVGAGQRLATVAAPELAATQRELLDARAAGDTLTADAARRRLLGWGVADADVDAVIAAGAPSEALAVRAPAAGVVLDPLPVPGAMVAMGMPLLRLARADAVWVEATLPPADATALAAGQPVRVGLPDGEVEARVAAVLPTVDPATRGQRFRVALDRALPAGTFVPVTVPVDLGERLALPVDAVIHAGARDVVFVDQGGDRLVPRTVTLGARSGDWREVREGLAEGDRVVAEGAFLVAAESRLRSAGAWR